MKQLFILSMTLLFNRSYGQTKAAKVFKKTEYANGSLYRETFDTVELGGKKIDIYFLRTHFDIPYYLPDRFVDSRYKNQTVSIWRDSLAKKDIGNNWENTYTYDKLDRITNYAYSGCIVCSNMPYNYIVTYNSSGQVDRIKNIIAEKDSYHFFYNDRGDIQQFDCYSSNKLEKRIAMIY